MLSRSVESESEPAPKSDAVRLLTLLQRVGQAHRSCRANLMSGANVK